MNKIKELIQNKQQTQRRIKKIFLIVLQFSKSSLLRKKVQMSIQTLVQCDGSINIFLDPRNHKSVLEGPDTTWTSSSANLEYRILKCVP
jgi:hypothetical protein